MVSVVVPRKHDVRRQVWHQQAGAPDKKAAVDLVGIDFGFKDNDGCVASPSEPVDPAELRLYEY
jgi:hypothetical protein